MAHTRNLTNGMAVIERRGTVILVRLPPELQTDCGGCRCPFCKAHPELTPMWDTLAIAQAKPGKGNDHTWTVHHPGPGAYWEPCPSAHPAKGE